MYYQPRFPAPQLWAEYLASRASPRTRSTPTPSCASAYARLLDHRQPRYAAMASWGVTVTAEEVAAASRDAAGFDRPDRRGP